MIFASKRCEHSVVPGDSPPCWNCSFLQRVCSRRARKKIVRSGLCRPEPSIAPDWTIAIPVAELLPIEGVISALAKHVDVFDIKIKANLVIDIEIGQIWYWQQALLELPPHLVVDFFEMADKPRRIKKQARIASSNKFLLKGHEQLWVLPKRDCSRDIFVRRRADHVLETRGTDDAGANS